MKLAILTSGGDAPGMNAAVRTAARTAFSMDLEPMKVEGGYKGLLAGNISSIDRRSLTGASKLHDLGVRVAGIPATIDNDVWGTEISLGVDTALNTALGAIDRI